jgi:HAE1 family hydrophobic/amphiphilic exporter-1
MGQAVIGGVITSSLLTLVVVPVVYCYLDDLVNWLRRKSRGAAGVGAAPSASGGGGAEPVPASKMTGLP